MTPGHNGPNLLPLEKRLNATQLARRNAKHQDRTDFRARTKKTFELVGQGLNTIDLAVATVYGRFTRFVYISVALWVIFISLLVWSLTR